MGVIDRVKGRVVAIAVIEVVMQDEGERVNVTERVRETVMLFVKGLVLGMALRVTVIEVERVGN